MSDLSKILKQYWGYDNFLPLQKEAMECVINKRDSVVVLPTGGGKSLCFQAPAMCMDGMALVVSPLISLMKDQVDALTNCGISAACINSSLSLDERRMVANEIRRGNVKILYLAPERLVMESFLEFIKQVQVSFIAVDEAHCISFWGHDFRPEYRELRILKDVFNGINIHAYTATATEHVRRDISSELRLTDPNMLVGSFDRANLIYNIEQKHNNISQVCSAIDRHPSESGIIYCIRRADVDDMCADLKKKGYKALPYHAGMANEDRKRNQDAFIHEEADIIVATIAFGMGIDKSNIRYVIHAGMPKSLEHYHQETGRAGRDGLDAECYLFYSFSDFMLWKSMLSDMDSEPARVAIDKLNDMYSYCSGASCRHKAIVEYFGQEFSKESCEACDMCLQRLVFIDDSLIIAQKIISCVLRLKAPFGVGYITRVLIGSKDKRIIGAGHDKLSTYGIMSSESRQNVHAWIEQLVSQCYLQKGGEYNVISITERAWNVIKGLETPQLLKPTEKPAKQPKLTTDSWDGVDRGLFNALRALRREKADEMNVPAFIVFGDATLRDIARRRPSDMEEFLKVSGVGQKKCEAYGREFVNLVTEYCKKSFVEMDIDSDNHVSEDINTSVKNPSKTRAFELFESGTAIDEVAILIGRAQSTVYGYLEEYIYQGNITDPSPWVDDEKHFRIVKAIQKVGMDRLKPIHESLNGEIPYEQIRVSVACLKNLLRGGS